jgi:ribose 5-phosphate isomerase B
MKIAIGSDHAAFEEKEKLLEHLAEQGHEMYNAGTHSDNSTDYPIYAKDVANNVANGVCDIGILICGTGIGMTMTANKTEGIRAALVHDEFTTEMSRKHNDANVLCMGARVLDYETIEKLTDLWIKTEYEGKKPGGERHAKRVAMIDSKP